MSAHPTWKRRSLSWALTIAICAGAWWTVTYLGLTLGVVRSGSMQPTFAPKDTVLAIGTNMRQPAIGDIVIATPTLGHDTLAPTVHRIVDKNSNGWITKGDNNPSIDPWYLRDSDINAVVIRPLPTSALSISPALLAGLLAIVGAIILWPTTTKTKPDTDATTADTDATTADT